MLEIISVKIYPIVTFNIYHHSVVMSLVCLEYFPKMYRKNVFSIFKNVIYIEDMLLAFYFWLNDIAVANVSKKYKHIKMWNMFNNSPTHLHASDKRKAETKYQFIELSDLDSFYTTIDWHFFSLYRKYSTFINSHPPKDWFVLYFAKYHIFFANTPKFIQMSQVYA